MRFAVETWAPEYGTPSEAELAEVEVLPDVSIEVDAGDWGPMLPDVDPVDDVVFVDGVRRVDANVWIDQESGVPALGLCATYAAGAVRCNGTAEVVAAEVRRGLFTAADGAESIETRHGDYRVHRTSGSTPEELWLGIQSGMGRLEGEVSAGSREAGLVVVDGPLSHHRHVPEAVGFIKTQHRHHLPEAQRPVAASLPAGRRTPLFLISQGPSRYSWYLRLAVGSGPLGGVVRCEASADRSVSEAARLADQVTATLPRFASQAHKDPRAPQNLYPIGGLERALRRRLGDPQLMFRALRRAAG